ncbi:MAG: hypothetical protein WDN46_08040 [Methylocella sp.]
MSNEITIASTSEEIERLKGHLLVVETALGKLVWCCARDARRHGDWLAAYLVALRTEHECWADQPPLGEAAMHEAEDRLGGILQALDQGALAICPKS